MSSRYAAIGRHLEEQQADQVELDFAQIEQLLGFPLPMSARKYDQWWHGGSTHTQTRGWEDFGWSLTRLDRRGQRANFRRLPGAKRVAAPSVPCTARVVKRQRSEQSTHAAAAMRTPVRPSPDHPRIGLVGCVKMKLDYAAPARDLYVSPLFRGRRAWVERSCSQWFVLSALHGVLDLDDVVEPYDVTLNNASTAERRAWSAKVIGQLEGRLGSLAGRTFEIHAGANYIDYGLIDSLRAKGALVEIPLAGLKMGEQLSAYNAATWQTGQAGDTALGVGPHPSAVQATSESDGTGATRPAGPDYPPAMFDAALDALNVNPLVVRADRWPDGVAFVNQPGLYSWWVDEAGAADLSRGLGLTIEPGRIYAGQAGATYWPSGKVSDNTLGKRIGQMHLGGKVRMSTFRWTLAAALYDQLGLQVQASMLITPSSEQALSEWMRGRLSIAVHPHDDRDTLAGLEHAVLEYLDPPLNLGHMAPTPVRARLTELRRRISRDT